MDKKRVIASTLIAALAMPTSAFAAKPTDFTDFPHDWSSVALEHALDNDLLVGIDGKIEPAGTVTRAQMATIMSRAFSAKDMANISQFTDVSKDAWYYTEIARAVQMGALKGSGANSMRPEDNITREEAFSVLTRLFELEGGNVSALNKFTDAADVSDWAKTSVAAMVQSGYVHGDDQNRINPKGYITRAEFAAVMDNLVTLYVDQNGSLPSRIRGNVVVRADGLDLSGKTIEGDLIISDGVNKIDLTNTTVTGRIIVRGAEQVKLDGVTADQMIVNNPSETVNLDVVKSSVKKVVAKTNVNLSGEVKVVEVNGNNVTVSGNAKVDQVLANGSNIKVTVPGALVVAGPNSSLVTAGNLGVAPGTSERVPGGDVKPGEEEKDPEKDPELKPDEKPDVKPDEKPDVKPDEKPDVKPDEKPDVKPDEKPDVKPDEKPDKPDEKPDKPDVDPDKPDVDPDKPDVNPSPNPKPNPGGGEITPDTPESGDQQETKLVEKVRVADFGWSQFITAQLTEGNTIENCKFAVDGVDITDAVTPVTDDGSVIKWEVSYWEHGTLTVTNGDQSQEWQLNGNAKRPVVVKDQMPDYFLLNGPVYVWDYHLTNYDDAGNVRVTPKQTTISVGKTATQIPYYSPDTVITEDKNSHYGVKGEVQLMFNYEKGTEADKAFVDGITDVDLVSYNENKTTLNDELNYTVVTDMPHGNSTVACVKVPVGQENFYNNGRYYLRITSNGTAKLFPIHLVNSEIPTMVKTSNTGENGTSVQFKIENMTYAITSPIYRVDLTDPSGETVTLNKIDDWFLNNDLLTIYNDEENHFPTTGNYTVKVYADGFQPFEKTFHQDAIKGGSASKAVKQTMPKNSATSFSVDAVSAATSGGGSSEGGEGGGDTNVMNAFLIMDSDLLVNAELVKELGIESQAAEGIANRYENMQTVSVFNEGAKDVYDFDHYHDAVNTARSQGRYLTFDEYIAGGNAVKTLNRPGAVKNVLEDNLLGQTINFREASGIDVPTLTVKESSEKQVVFTCADEMFLRKLADSGELFLNKDYPALARDQYQVDPEAGTLTVTGVKLGDNKLKIKVPEYKVKELTFNVEKELEEVTLSAPAEVQAGNAVTVSCGEEGTQSDFLKYVTGVDILLGDDKIASLLPEGQVSFEKGQGYEVKDNTITIGKDVFLQNGFKDSQGAFKEGTYTIAVNAEYYGTNSVQIQVTAPEDTTKPVDPSQLKDAPTLKGVDKGIQNQYLIQFEDGEYTGKVTGIKLNDQVYYSSVSDKGYYGAAGGTVTLNDIPSYNIGSKANTLVISAEGYKDATVTFYMDAQGNISTEKPAELKKAPKYSVTDYNEGVGQIIAFAGDDGKAYVKAVTSVKVNGKLPNFDYKSAGEGNVVLLNSDLQDGNNTILIQAKGFEDLTVTLKKPEAQKPGELLAAPALKGVDRMPNQNVYYLQFENIDYANAITEVKLNGQTFTKETEGNTSFVASNGNLSLRDMTYNNPGVANTVEITATGYKTNTVTFYIDAQGNISTTKPESQEAPEYTVSSDSVKQVITFDGAGAEEYREAITSVTVNDGPIFFDWKDGGTKTVTILNSALTDGDNTVKIQAKGYKDLTVTLKKTQTPQEQNAPSGVVTKGLPGSYQIDFKDSDYVGKVKSVKVNGVVYENNGSLNGCYSAAGEVVTLKDIPNLNTGDTVNTVEITATGYKTNTVTFYLDQQGNPSAQKPVLKQAPAYVVQSDSSNTKQVLSFEGQAGKDYVGQVKKVTVNGQEQAFQAADPKSGTVSILNSALTLPENTVVIQATGYEDLTVTVKKPEAPTPGKGKTAPAVGDVANSFFPGEYTLNWQDIDYVNAITGININEVDYQEGTAYGASGNTMTLKQISNLKKDGSANTMVIHAKGYQDATVTFYFDQKGKITLEAPVIVKEVPGHTVAADSETENMVITFTGEGAAEFVKAIQTVTVNGGSLFYQPANQDNNTVSIHYGDLKQTDNVVLIQADGYKDVSVNIASSAIVKKIPTYTSNNDGENNAQLIVFSGNGAENYMNAISSVKVNGTPVSGAVDASKKTVTIPNTLLTKSENAILIEAAGYQNLSFNMAKPVVAKKDAPEVTVKHDRAKNVAVVTVTGDNAKAYLTSIQKVIVNGPNEVEFALTENAFTIPETALTEETNNVVVQAQGYKDLELNIAKMPALKQPIGLKSVQNGSVSGQYELNFGDEAYVSSVTSIQVNGTVVQGDDAFGKDGEKLLLKQISGYNTGSTVNTVVVTADGYQDGTVNFYIDSKGNITTVAPVELKKIPKFSVQTGMEQGTHDIVLSGNDAQAYWLALKTNNITINGKPVKGEPRNITGRITIYDNELSVGENTIRINVEGYEEMSVTITKKAPVSGKAVPTVHGITKTSTFDGVRLNIKFNTTGDVNKTALDTYLNALVAQDEIAVFVNGVAVQKDSWGLKPYKALNSSDPYAQYEYDTLQISEAALQGSGVLTVTLKVKGYQDLTFKVQNGQLVSE